MNHSQSTENYGLPGTVNSGSGLSALAGQKDSSSYKSEMVILIKPTIIQDDRNWQRDIEQTSDRMRNFGLPPVPASSQ